MAEMRNAQRIFMKKHEGRRPLGRPRCRWEDNIKTGFKEVVWWGTDWVDLAQDRNRWWAVVNAVMNFGFHNMRGIS
jgi:hypothetical protein